MRWRVSAITVPGNCRSCEAWYEAYTLRARLRWGGTRSDLRRGVPEIYRPNGGARLANGGRDVAGILKHATSDSLVLWAWQPGPARTPAPGSNAEFGKLLAAWAETGAHCPVR